MVSRHLPGGISGRRLRISRRHPKTGERKLNPAENWVVAQVTAGKEADLREKFPNEVDRKLGGHFLEDLLTGELLGVKPQRIGVRISGAIIDEPNDLSNAQIAYEVWLDYCQFMRPVMFLEANFARRATFEETKFKADANFAGMKVGDTVVFTKTVFEGPVNFSEAQVGNFEANEAQFHNTDQVVDFKSIKVGHWAFFNKAVFAGGVDFGFAEVASNFEADGAKFQNKEKGASFISMKVRGYASFNDTVFEGTRHVRPDGHHRHFYGGEGKVSEQGKWSQLHQYQACRRRRFQRCGFRRAGQLRLGRPLALSLQTRRGFGTKNRESASAA